MPVPVADSTRCTAPHKSIMGSEVPLTPSPFPRARGKGLGVRGFLQPARYLWGRVLRDEDDFDRVALALLGDAESLLDLVEWEAVRDKFAAAQLPLSRQ